MKKKRKITAIDHALSYLIFGLFFCIGLIPHSLAKKAGNFIGDLAFRFDRRHREVTIENLSLAFGNSISPFQRLQMAKSVFRNLGQIIFEIGWTLRANHQAFDRRLEMEGLDNYLRACSKGSGVLVITAHIGNWEILPFVAARTKIRTNIIYRRIDFKPLDLFFERIRQRFNARLIPHGNAMLKIIRALKRGESVAILIDQTVDWYDGVWVDFFGYPACTSKGMALIALKARCPVVPVFLYRQSDGFRVVFGKEIPVIHTGDKISDVEQNTLEFTKVVETAIRRHPEQWFWVHRRWKRKPFSPWPRTPDAE